MPSGTCCCRCCSDRWLAGAQQDVVQTGAASLAAMNQHIVALGQAAPSLATLKSLAQVLAAGQTVLSQAATQLATGAVRPTPWAASYGPSALPDIYSKAKARMYSILFAYWTCWSLLGKACAWGGQAKGPRRARR